MLELGKKTYVMGILNVTPDSFSDGGKWTSYEKIIERAHQIQNEGADILDIGAQSTRPGFSKITPAREWERMQEVLPVIRKDIDIPISVDTFYPEVAKKCLDIGIDIVNDVTGCKDEKMYKLACNYGCGLIVTHSTSDMNIKYFFEKSLIKSKSFGLDRNQLCFDPGVGFNKNQIQDAEIIKSIRDIKIEKNAFLVGLSRKRVIGINCGNPPPDKRLFGTIAANTLCISEGADIIRVHDVAPAVQAVMVTDAILKGGQNLKHE